MNVERWERRRYVASETIAESFSLFLSLFSLKRESTELNFLIRFPINKEGYCALL